MKLKDKFENAVTDIFIKILMIVLALAIVAGITLGVISLIRSFNKPSEGTTNTTVETEVTTIPETTVDTELSLNDGNEQVFG